jgi:hypothetical protein
MEGQTNTKEIHSKDKSVLEMTKTVTSDEKLIGEEKKNADEDKLTLPIKIKGEDPQSEFHKEAKEKSEAVEENKSALAHPKAEEEEDKKNVHEVKKHADHIPPRVISSVEETEKKDVTSDAHRIKEESLNKNVKKNEDSKDIVNEEEIAKEFREDNEVSGISDTEKKTELVSVFKKREGENEFDQINELTLVKKQNNSESECKMKIAQVARTTLPKISNRFSDKNGFSLNGLILEKMKVYDGLRDNFLQPFFSNNNRKQILIKNGLVTDDGYIVKKPDEYLKKKNLYFKSNYTPEEVTKQKANTVDDKKFNPYKENAMAVARVIASKFKVRIRTKKGPVIKRDTKPVISK